jgi:hypothetical protein
MSRRSRRNHTFKAKVALAVIMSDRTLGQLADQIDGRPKSDHIVESATRGRGCRSFARVAVVEQRVRRSMPAGPSSSGRYNLDGFRPAVEDEWRRCSTAPITWKSDDPFVPGFHSCAPRKQGLKRCSREPFSHY